MLSLFRDRTTERKLIDAESRLMFVTAQCEAGAMLNAELIARLAVAEGQLARALRRTREERCDKRSVADGKSSTTALLRAELGFVPRAERRRAA